MTSLWCNCTCSFRSKSIFLGASVELFYARHTHTQNRTQRVVEIVRLQAELDQAHRLWDGEKARDCAFENIRKLTETLKEKFGELRAVQGARHRLRPPLE